MQKVTQANKNTFFSSVSIGETYSFSRSISLHEIKILAKKSGVSIDYISTYQFIIKEREQSISQNQTIYVMAMKQASAVKKQLPVSVTPNRDTLCFAVFVPIK